MQSARIATILVGLLGGLGGSALLACSAAPPEPTGASLEIGTGTARFAPLSDGAEIPLVRGAQGGWHMWISVRASGLDTAFGSVEVAHGPADESRPMDVTRAGATFDPPDALGRRSMLGWPAILADPSCSVGRLHRVRVTVTTATGQRASAEVELIPTGGDHPPPPCGSPPLEGSANNPA